MIYKQPHTLSGYINEMLSVGRTVFTADEAANALNVSHGAFLDSAERQQRRRTLLRPRRNFYVAIPPQFAKWGAPPPNWYIDALMGHEEQNYYVGLLEAAAYHGATHQAVMEFQVVTSKRLPQIRAGRSRIAFYYRKDIAAVAAGIEKRKTDTGTMQISSPALTALDILRYPYASAGIHNIATVLLDMGSKIDSKQLAQLSSSVECSVAQRLGYLLDWFGFDTKARALHARLKARGLSNWTELDPTVPRDPIYELDPIRRNEKWRVIVRRDPDPD